MSRDDRYAAGYVHLTPAAHDWDSPSCNGSQGDSCLPLVAALPHQCDSWVIGGPDEVRQMIADLIDALNKLAPEATMPQTEAGFRGRKP